MNESAIKGKARIHRLRDEVECNENLQESSVSISSNIIQDKQLKLVNIHYIEQKSPIYMDDNNYV